MLASCALSSSHLAAVNTQLMPNKLVADRADFSKLIKEKGLVFHTLSHAQYATMVLVHSIAAEQRANNITDSISAPSALAGSMCGGGSAGVHLVGAGGSLVGRDHHISSMHVPPSMRGARLDHEDADYQPYHMHCPTGLFTLMLVYLHSSFAHL